MLASYGVAAWPFTKQPIPEYFWDYCRKFHIRTNNPVKAYERHFFNEYKRRGISGYKLIKVIHRSNERSFSRCRRKFSLTEIPSVKAEIPWIETELRASKLSSLMLFLNDQGHSMAAFGVSGGFLCFDARPTKNGFSPLLHSLTDIQHDLGEGLLMRES